MHVLLHTASCASDLQERILDEIVASRGIHGPEHLEEEVVARGCD